MSVLRFVPILGRKERAARRWDAINVAMEGAGERGFLSLPFRLTDDEAAIIRARWNLDTRLAHPQTARIVRDHHDEALERWRQRSESQE